jgi:hypothetical protein
MDNQGHFKTAPRARKEEAMYSTGLLLGSGSSGNRRQRPAPWRLEPLEPRRLLNGASLGPLVQVSGVSPLLFDTSDIAGQSGRAFLNSEVEPQVAVNPADPRHVVAIWQQDRWSGTSARGLVAAVSHDAGASWDVVPIPGFSPVLGGAFSRYSDPWVTFGPGGQLYAAALAVTTVGPFPAHSAILVTRSLDDGHSWAPPTSLAETHTDPSSNPIDLLQDKETITADPLRPGYAYAIWSRLNQPSDGAGFNAFHGLAFRGDILFARTTNGGATWQTSVLSAPSNNEGGIGHQIVVMPATSAHPGRLVDVYGAFQGSDSQPTHSARDKVKVIYSDDAGLTWSEPAVIADMLDAPVTHPDNGGPIRVGEPIPDVAVDPRNGNLYAVWLDTRFSSKKDTFDSVALAVSRDGGATWSQPIRVNQTPTANVALPGNRQAFVPDVAVTDNGVVGVSYYDFRNNTPAAGLPVDHWLARATGNPADPASWTGGGEVRLTTFSSDMENAPVSRGFFLGDYEGLAAAGDRFYTLFAQAGPGSADPSNIFFRAVAVPAASAPAAASRPAATVFSGRAIAELADVLGSGGDVLTS